MTTFFHSRSGGIKRYLERKARFLSETDLEHILVIPGVKSRTYKLFKSTVYEVSSISLPKSSGYRIFSKPGQLREIIKKERPDIVELGGSFFLTPVLGFEDLRLVIFYHSHLEEYLSFLPAGKLIRRIFGKRLTLDFLKRAKFVITPSLKIEDLLRQYGVRNIATVPLGVDPELFYLSGGQTSGRERTKVLYSGRLSKEKGIDLLIEIIKILPKEKYEMWIAGYGPERRRIQKLCQMRENVTYLGYISDEKELARFYRLGDIFLSTSPFETFGLSFIEAQACGCALVARDLGLETQPFKDFLVRDGKLEDYISALDLASRERNWDFKEALSKLIRERFSWKRSFEKLLEVYRNFCG